jgi:penicillin-binding protein 2
MVCCGQPARTSADPLSDKGADLGYSTGRNPWRSEAEGALSDENRAVRQQLFYLGLVVVTIFGILTLQLFRLQILRGDEYRLRADTNRLRVLPVMPTRGLVYDRNGLPLVENRASFAAAVVPADVPKEQQQQIAITLQELVGVPADEIIARVEARRLSNDPFSPLIIKDDISAEVAFALRERIAKLPGARVVIEPKRYYVEGALLSHVLGFVGPVDQEEYARLRSAGYQINDRIGKTGVELTYESILRGIPGVKEVEADASGRELRTLREQPAKPGQSLVLSLDIDLQRAITDLLRQSMGRSRNAVAIVMDVRNGEILALVSLPAFDNNLFTGKVDDAAVQRLLNDPGKPLLNHAIAEMYPPGSVFKQITGLAALQEGIANAGTRITSLGAIRVQNQYNPSLFDTFRDWAALGTLDFYGGIAMSSDVYFYYLSGGYSEGGREVFRGLGATRLAEWARRFGLGDKVGIDLPGESEGIVPDPRWKEQTVGVPWVLGDTYNFGIGQGYVATTPIQIAVATAAVANGGEVLVPHVLREVRDMDGGVVRPPYRTVKTNLNIDLRNINIMREAMRRAVDTGTARTAASKEVRVAGKTGTAEFGEQRPDGSYQEHGWFAGFAPFDNPEIVVVVFHEQGGGALTAAPVAAKIFDYYFARKKLASGN